MTTYRFRALTESTVANWHAMDDTNRRKALLRGTSMDDEFDSGDYDDDGPEPDCSTCGGSGWVDSVSQSSGRWGWDTDGPGDCPNCGGSGLRKDQRVF